MYNQRDVIVNFDSADDDNNFKKIEVNLIPIEDIDESSDKSFERKQKNYATPSNIRKSLAEENEGVMITFNKSHQPEILMHKHGHTKQVETQIVEDTTQPSPAFLFGDSSR